MAMLVPQAPYRCQPVGGRFLCGVDEHRSVVHNMRMHAILALLIPLISPAADAELLAQCAVGENGFYDIESQNASMHVVLERFRRVNRWKEAVPLRIQTLQFCAALDGRRPWILHLHGKQQPKAWPSNVRWSKHADLWLDALERAKMALMGTLPNPAPGACDWGGRTDTVPKKGEVRVWYKFRKRGNVFFCP